MDDDPLLGSGLLPITFNEQARFTACFDTLSDPLSDFTFSQLFTWGNSLRILWKEIRGHLCVFANGTGDLTLLMPPIGEGNGDPVLAEAFEIMDAYNAHHRVYDRSRVEYVSEELLARFDRSKLAISPMGADYVYDVNRMIDLPGGDLASKRQLKNRFTRYYDYRIEFYEPQRHRAGCQELLNLWKNQQDAHHQCERLTSAVKRQKETLACELALEHAGALGLKGIVVYVRSKPDEAAAGQFPDWSLRGFTFGEPLGRDSCSVVIEKTDLAVRGLAQFIFSEFCRLCWADRPLVNAGDDWGLETLAWTKQSYRPAKLLPKYEIRLAAPIAVSMPVGGRDLGAVAAAATAQLTLFKDADAAIAKTAELASVRPARKADVAAAVQLEQNCFSAFCLSKRQLQYLQNRPSAVFLVAEHAGQVVGEGISLVRKHKKGLSGRIYSLAVDNRCRRQRIGERLLKAMIEGLAQRGVQRVYLEVERSNSAAITLYERNGFRSIGVLPDYYGPGRDGVHMVCNIFEAGEPSRSAKWSASMAGPALSTARA